MALTIPPELANLPLPSLIEELGYEARLTAFRTKLVELFNAAGLDYDVDNLETDPAQIILQAASYIDMLLRERINQAIRSTLLPFAEGGDLDLLAAFYDVTRLDGETDDRLRVRLILNIRGRSTGGTAPRYRAIAMGASIRVADASVYTVGRDPTVHVAIFATDNGGVADEGLLELVDAALQDPNVRMVNDRIVVAGAARYNVAVTADVWVLPEAPISIADSMEAALRAAWAQELVLGRDVTVAWLTARLMIPGVQRVTIVTPATDVLIPPSEAAGIGAISLIIRGRDY